MPSVRVRRNTATAAALVPPERLQNLSTNPHGCSQQEETTPEQRSDGSSDADKDMKDGGVVILAPPISTGETTDGNTWPETLPSATTTTDHATQPMSASASPTKKGSGMVVPSTSQRRPRSRTIQAIFPSPAELLEELTVETRWPKNIDTERNVIHEEPSSISPIQDETQTRRSRDLRRSLSHERTRRAEAIARARGVSVSSTSGSAPIAIRLPTRDQSQVDDSATLGSPTSAGSGEGSRRRSASISLGLTGRLRKSDEQARISGERPRSATHHLAIDSEKPKSESVSSATPGIVAGPRSRSKTIAGPASATTRRRADSVGLMSYFGLGDGVEAKLQSWEDTRRDLEKGLPYGGKAVRAVGELTPTSEASEEAWEDEQHDDEVVEHLDVIDPQIGAVSHLQNFANSVMIPYFPELYSRKPMLDLPTPATSRPSAGQPAPSATNTSGLRLRKPTLSTQQPEPSAETVSTPDKFQIKPAHKDSDTIESSEEDALDQHVKDVLHKSKREWLKRSLKGVWTFLKTPMGIITGIYGFLVVFWGAALVLFLVGWIPTSSKNTQDIWVEICSQIVNGLFTVTGVGFIPWRVMDVYRIFRIWQLKRLSVKLRKKRGLPPIEDPDDLPDPKLDPTFVPVLSEYQQALLEYEQEQFMASQTWYRPHATETHRAFSITWALWICWLIIGNSVFQCMLCGCMWGLNRHQRPAWTTGSLIPLSFSCGIASGILIWKGGERTKKKAQVEEKLRKALGMEGKGSKEGLLDNEENPAQTSSVRAEVRSCNDSDVEADVGNASAATPVEPDSQRLLASMDDSPATAK